MQARDVETTLIDMSASAISARLEQVSQLFEVSRMLKSAKKVVPPAATDNALPKRAVEAAAGDSYHVFQHNDKP